VSVRADIVLCVCGLEILWTSMVRFVDDERLMVSHLSYIHLTTGRRFSVTALQNVSLGVVAERGIRMFSSYN
jgi:hypothetical protein